MAGIILLNTDSDLIETDTLRDQNEIRPLTYRSSKKLKEKSIHQSISLSNWTSQNSEAWNSLHEISENTLGRKGNTRVIKTIEIRNKGSMLKFKRFQKFHTMKQIFK